MTRSRGKALMLCQDEMSFIPYAYSTLLREFLGQCSWGVLCCLNVHSFGQVVGIKNQVLLKSFVTALLLIVYPTHFFNLLGKIGILLLTPVFLTSSFSAKFPSCAAFFCNIMYVIVFSLSHYIHTVCCFYSFFFFFLSPFDSVLMKV